MFLLQPPRGGPAMPGPSLSGASAVKKEGYQWYTHMHTGWSGVTRPLSIGSAVLLLLKGVGMQYGMQYGMLVLVQQEGSP